ncbi:MAG: 16S rRNA (guanine(527)-N(7))-methyltransferase RsmG [Acidobacteria bacterium]|nr:16S rRNA (guanine(527)-N(7))-methyltransferase RsmG [Acidobacteriota bacterium]
MVPFKKLLEEEGKRIGLELPPEVLERSDRYYRLLAEWNQKVSLTSIVKEEEVVRYHFLEGFFLAQFLPGRGKMVDVGSGAGFPALPAKLLLSKMELILVEPVMRKVLFLREVVRALSLSSVEVFRGRMEELSHFYRDLQADVVTSRALGRYDAFFSFCRQALSPSGRAILFVSERGRRDLSSSTSGFSLVQEVQLPTRRRGFLLFFSPG